jgi:hypothetical protein
VNSHQSPQSMPRRKLDAAGKAYWWRVPDDEELLMRLRPAELKCYLVITRAVQRDSNGGKLSIRQIAERARLAPQHAHGAIGVLLDRGLLLRDGKPGSTAVYNLPAEWVGGKNDDGSARPSRPSRPNCSPTGEQLRNDSPPQGEQRCSPTGIRNCSPTGEQHLEYSESSELSASRTVQHHRRGCEDDDAEDAYQQQVLELLQRRVGTPRKLSADDQALCREWRLQGIPVIVVERAIVLGCLRKHAAAINNGTGPVRIASLKYFAGVLAEAQDPASGPDYWAHQEQRLRRVEASVGVPDWSPSLRDRVDGGDQVNGTGEATVKPRPPQREPSPLRDVSIATGGAL